MYSRRTFVKRNFLMAGSALAGTQIVSSLAATSPEPVRKVAGILTWSKRGSHADVLIGKILEGWRCDGGVGPRLELASLYVDQFPEDDMARALSEKHGFPIFNSIEDALSLQSDALAVDGVLSIGEHGDYPTNSKGQKLYPRKRFFEGITRAFRQLGRVVPVFSDKHLGPVWEDAKWMYDQAQALNIPFMAGSSLPVSFRQPDWAPPMGSSMMAAVGVGYSGLDIYGTHTLEVYQAMVERRLGGETGVRSVQWFGAVEMWQKVEDGTVDAKVLQAALDATPKAVALQAQCGIWKEMGWACSSLNTLMDFKVPSSCYPVTWPGVALLRGWEEMPPFARWESRNVGNRITRILPICSRPLKPWYGPAGPAIPSRGPCSHRGCWIGY